MTNLAWLATFLVSDEISEDFQNWMENEHFPSLQETGCFEDGIGKLSQQQTKPGFDSIVYFHGPKSQEDWDRYQTEFRPKKGKEFMDKWDKALGNGQIQVIQCTNEIKAL